MDNSEKKRLSDVESLQGQIDRMANALDTCQHKLRDVQEENERLRAALAEVVDGYGDPCFYDDKGYCLSHLYVRPCLMERLRALLQEVR